MMQIKVRFNNEEEELECVQESLYKFLKSEHIYNYDETTKVRDFFTWLLNRESQEEQEYDEEELVERLLLVYEEEYVRLNINLPLYQIIKNFHIKDTILLNFVIGIGGGYGVSIKNMIIRINTNEQSHYNAPHVHVYKGKFKKGHDNVIGIDLKSLTQLKKENKKIEELFSKKDRDLLFKVLEENKEYLIKNYELIQKGASPVTFEVTVDGELFAYFK